MPMVKHVQSNTINYYALRCNGLYGAAPETIPAPLA